MSQDLSQFKILLYAALAEPIGLLIATNDFGRARAAFYRARAEAADPALAQLQFRASPGLDDGQLIIVKQHIALPALAEI